MKNLFICTILLCTVLLSTNLVRAQKSKEKNKTIEFPVKGVCGMCEKRIEQGTLAIKGVKLADWDKEEQSLKVIYRVGKISEEDIHKGIALLGHDTDKMKASPEAYKRLPACCSYRDGIKAH